ncbi:MAG: hypothetical protein AAGB10_21305 [Pseudomonadota bacterium]
MSEKVADDIKRSTGKPKSARLFAVAKKMLFCDAGTVVAER